MATPAPDHATKLSGILTPQLVTRGQYSWYLFYLYHACLLLCVSTQFNQRERISCLFIPPLEERN